MTERLPTFRWLLSKPIALLGFGFGTGLAPKVPGTFGTLPALPIAWLLMACGLHTVGLLIISALAFIVGIYICDYTEKALGIQDYGGIVWDEIAAMLLILAVVPATLPSWVAAFALFRLFDAVKPWPIKWFDARIHGGFGIMLDDLIAALFVLAVYAVIHLFGVWG